MATRHAQLALALCCLLVHLAGCSTEAWYEGMKRGAENECYRLPPGESEACLKRVNDKTYQEYEKERSGG